MTTSSEYQPPKVRCQSCGTLNDFGREACECGADLPEFVPYLEQRFDIPDDLQPNQELVYLIDQMLDNPVDKHGNTYDFRYLKTLLSWHFARCWPAKYGGDPKVKRRVYPGGYVEWVPLDAPDLPADPLNGLTLEEIMALPPEQRDAAIRKLQAGEDGPVADPDSKIPWVVRTNIQIDEEALR